MKKLRGFTIVEVILVLVIVTSALGFGLLYYQNSQLRADINTQASILVSYLRLAQSNAESGRNDFNAIHFEADSFTTFIGTTFDQNNADNYQLDLPETIKIENISLNGGGGNVLFESPDGATSNFGTIKLSSGQINKEIIIYISQIGAINY